MKVYHITLENHLQNKNTAIKKFPGIPQTPIRIGHERLFTLTIIIPLSQQSNQPCKQYSHKEYILLPNDPVLFTILFQTTPFWGPYPKFPSPSWLPFGPRARQEEIRLAQNLTPNSR